MTQRQQLLSYWKILEFFHENPFETEFCGVSKHDSLQIVQLYLDEQSVQQRPNIPLLQYINYSQKRGKEFQEEYKGFLTSLEIAKGEIADRLDTVTQSGSGDNEEELPASINNNAILKNITSEFESHVIKTAGEDTTSAGRGWIKGVAFFRGDKAKRQIIENGLFQIKINQEEEELNRDRQAKITASTSRLATQVAAGQNLTSSQEQKVKNIAEAVFKEGITDGSDEEKTWQSLTFSAGALLGGQQFDQKTYSQKQEEVRSFYQKRIIETIAEAKKTDAELLTVDEKQISQNLAALPILAGQPSVLTELSYQKYSDQLSTHADLTARQELTTGLLLGKVLIAADDYLNGITGLTPQQKSQKASDAVLGGLLDVLSRDEPVNSQEARTTLESHFKSAFGQDVQIDPSFDIAPELQTLKTARGKEALAKGDIQQKEFYFLPIPGLTFLNSMQRTEIVANKELYEQLKTKSVDDLFKDMRLEFFQNKAMFENLWRKDQAGGKLTAEEQKLYNSLSNKLVDYERSRATGKTVLLDDPSAYLFSQIGGLHTSSPNHKPSREEILLLKHYLSSWQRVAKVPFLGWITQKAAWLNSLGSDNFISRTIGKIPLVGNVFRGNNAMIWGLTKQAINVAFQDPSYLPLVAWQLGWGYVKGSTGLWVKSVYTGAIDSLFKKIGAPNSALKGLFYFRHHNMAYTPLGLLHPKQYLKVVAQKLAIKAAQFIVNSTVKIVARVFGNVAAEGLLTALGAAGVAAIPVVGWVLAALGVFKLIWDFLVPQFIKDWVKKIVKWGLAILAYLIAKMFIFLYGILGPLGLAGLLIGLMGGPIFGIVLVPLLTSAGVLAEIFIYLTTGVNIAPSWFTNAFPGLRGIGGGILPNINVLAARVGAGIGKAFAEAAANALKTMPWIAPAALGGVAVVSYLGVTFTTTALWTPITPYAGGPGAAYTSHFRVEKTAVFKPTDGCDEKTRKCPVAVLDGGKIFEFDYEIKIIIEPDYQIDEIYVQDSFSILYKDSAGNIQTDQITVPNFPRTILVTGNQVPGLATVLTLDSPSSPYAIHILLSDKKYQNSLVSNVVTATFGSEEAVGSYSFAIGTPPASRCPVDSPTITCGSLGSPISGLTCFHGSDDYWDYIKRVTGYAHCSFPIPVLKETEYIMGPVTDYSGTAKYCLSPKTGIASKYYGFAADIVGNRSVRFPASDEGANVKWKRINGPTENGGNAKYGWSMIYGGHDSKGTPYQLYVTHLYYDKSNPNDSFNPNINGGDSGESMGYMAENPYGIHLHFEISKINSTNEMEFLRPELQCQ